MPSARFVQRAETVDFIPGRDIASGEVIRLGKLIGVTKLPIKAGELGTLSISGVFDLDKPSGICFSAGSTVYWDSENGCVETAGDILLGIAIRRASETSDTVRILLNNSCNQTAVSDDDPEWQTL